MKRSREEIDADRALTSAIEAVIAAAFGETGEILQEFVVVAAMQGIDEDGESIDSWLTLYREGSVPVTRALGLLEAAASSLKRDRRASE
jgi:hypothetical protein